MFPVYSGKCLSFKGVRNLVANVSLMAKRLKWRYGAGFDALVKRWDKCINVLFFQFPISPVLRFISICVIFTDSHSYNQPNGKLK
jgi:hypothetical protein